MSSAKGTRRALQVARLGKSDRRWRRLSIVTVASGYLGRAVMRYQTRRRRRLARRYGFHAARRPTTDADGQPEGDMSLQWLDGHRSMAP